MWKMWQNMLAHFLLGHGVYKAVKYILSQSAEFESCVTLNIWEYLTALVYTCREARVADVVRRSYGDSPCYRGLLCIMYFI